MIPRDGSPETWHRAHARMPTLAMPPGDDRPTRSSAPLCHPMTKKINESLNSCPQLARMAFATARKAARWAPCGPGLTMGPRPTQSPDRIPEMIIRDATEADVPEIQSIYAITC